MTKNKTLLVLGLALLFSACGKDNTLSGGSGGGVGGPIGSSPITSGVPGAADLGTKIDNYSTQFGTGMVSYYGYPYTYQQLVNSGLNLAYRYTKSSTTGSGSNCEKKWGIFYVCSYSSTSSSVSVTESRKVFNNDIDVTSKMNELKAIINDANPLLPIYTNNPNNPNNSSYMITTRSGKQYVIDTRYPLQANPIGIKDSSSTEYLYNITEN